MNIAVMSTKGGVGKSTIAVNLAAIYGKGNIKTVYVELDPSASSTSTMLPKQWNKTKPGLLDILNDKADPLESVVKYRENFFVLPPGEGRFGIAFLDKDTYSDGLEWLLKRLEEEYKLVILDCPPGYSPYTLINMEKAEWILIPTEPDIINIRGPVDLVNFVDKVFKVGHKLIGIVLNMVDGREIASKAAFKIYKEHFGRLLLGTYIPRTTIIKKARLAGEPGLVYYAPDHKITKMFIKLSEEVLERVTKKKKKGR